jgi:hypothetical protein
MCPFLPLFVQESPAQGVDVLVSASVAHFGVMPSGDRVSHRGKGSDVSFFPGHSLLGRGASISWATCQTRSRPHACPASTRHRRISTADRRVSLSTCNSAWRRRVKKTRLEEAVDALLHLRLTPSVAHDLQKMPYEIVRRNESPSYYVIDLKQIVMVA